MDIFSRPDGEYRERIPGRPCKKPSICHLLKDLPLELVIA